VDNLRNGEQRGVGMISNEFRSGELRNGELRGVNLGVVN
jgi:hypothetical protein